MTTRAIPKAGQPCPCGSGQKYRDCCAVKRQARRRLVRRARKAVAWVGVVSVVAVLVYGISMMSGVAYGENDLAVVSFSGLDPSEKLVALKAANAARCTCGCGMTLAQCVATDSTCPVRSAHIETIREMVKQADLD
jgi:hypothetical protein